MPARDSVEMIKEQLRIKKKELQRRDAEQEKSSTAFMPQQFNMNWIILTARSSSIILAR